MLFYHLKIPIKNLKIQKRKSSLKNFSIKQQSGSKTKIYGALLMDCQGFILKVSTLFDAGWPWGLIILVS